MRQKLGKLTILAVVAILAISSMALPAAAATITVDDDGTADHNSIQDAVDAASVDDVIEVSGGTYYETVDIGTDNLTIQSASDETVEIVAVRSNGGDGTLAVDDEDTSADQGVNLGDNVETVNKSVMTIGDSGGDYLEVQSGVDNADPGTEIQIQPGTYEESVNVTVDHLVLLNSNPSADTNVTIDATNTSAGLAVRDNAEGLVVGDEIVTLDAAFAGGGGSGGIGGAETGTIVVVAVVVGGAWLVLKN